MTTSSSTVFAPITRWKVWAFLPAPSVRPIRLSGTFDHPPFGVAAAVDDAAFVTRLLAKHEVRRGLGRERRADVVERLERAGDVGPIAVGTAAGEAPRRLRDPVELDRLAFL